MRVMTVAGALVLPAALLLGGCDNKAVTPTQTLPADAGAVKPPGKEGSKELPPAPGK